MNKLKKLGCEQIFLLELYVIERGFSNIYNFPTSVIRSEVDKKIEKLKNKGFGYSMMCHEPLIYAHDEGNGINHMPYSILPTKDNEITESFKKLTKYIDDFYKEERIKYGEPRKFTVISYCKHCKNLIMVYSEDTSFICPKCGDLFL